MSPRPFLRGCFAALIYLGIVLIFGALHDYPQFRAHIQQVREHREVAERRQWLNLFYFINEAGSGIKYTMTGNRRHMRHYPTTEYLRQQSEDNGSNR